MYGLTPKKFLNYKFTKTQKDINILIILISLFRQILSNVKKLLVKEDLLGCPTDT